VGCRPSLRHEDGSRLGQYDTAARALEQRDAEVALKARDRLREWRLLDAEPSRGTIEARLFCYRQKVPEMCEIHIIIISKYIAMGNWLSTLLVILRQRTPGLVKSPSNTRAPLGKRMPRFLVTTFRAPKFQSAIVDEHLPFLDSRAFAEHC
jgi:hypothetical protein